MDLRNVSSPVVSCSLPRPSISGVHACRILPCKHQKGHMPAWNHTLSSVDIVVPNDVLSSFVAVSKRRKVLYSSDISCSADNLGDPGSHPLL
jgi:hypothetical protein